MIKKILLAAMIAASFGGVAAPAMAEIVVRVAPPPPRAEAVPAPRRGYVWTAGHWEWRRNHHVWVKGNWVRARRGYHYTQPTWVEHDGRWAMQRGGWARGDRDGDGVPNRVDDHPDNPHRN